MTSGFGNADKQKSLQQELLGWELYQVQVDKYHIMFWFENGWCLLNVAWRFAYFSADKLTTYVYDVQAEGGRKAFDVNRIVRTRIARVEFPDDWELHLFFENGDQLVVFDQPHMRSCWFYRYDNESAPPNRRVLWSVDDHEPDDVGRIEFVQHRIPSRP